MPFSLCLVYHNYSFLVHVAFDPLKWSQLRETENSVDMVLIEDNMRLTVNVSLFTVPYTIFVNFHSMYKLFTVIPFLFLFFSAYGDSDEDEDQ